MDHLPGPAPAPAPELTLRLARSRDPHEAQALAEMSRDLIEAGLGWRYTPPRIGALIVQPYTTVLVATHGARIDAFAVMHFGDDHAHLALLCVRPAQQRRGTGRLLCDWLLESARVAGIDSVRLELRADNSAALAFYQRLGFTPTHQVPGYYGSAVAAQRMVLRLRQAQATP